MDRDGDGYGFGCAGAIDCDDFDALVYPGAAERCDYIDNDCDGELDEGLNLGATCELNLPACSVEGLIGCAEGGRPRCVPLEPLEEICNGIDDDCDTETDEGDLGGDRDCELAWPGTCARGRLACTGGEYTCENRILPGEAEETCNGLDDDCDGQADNQVFLMTGNLSRECYGGPAGTGGIGACTVGAQLCLGGVWNACYGQVLPQLELCDHVDNNCDGLTDNAISSSCSCIPGSTRDCYGGAEITEGIGLCGHGSQTCDSLGEWGNCLGATVPQIEVCNTVDDDCDGTEDEDVAGEGTPCISSNPSEKFGICRREGALACNFGYLGCTFDDDPVTPETEICNGLDDDCDSRTDEGPDGSQTGQLCAVGVGACVRTGTWICRDTNDSAVVCNAVAGPPGVETCNGIDDDCDGVVDDGLGLGTACEVGLGACVRTGVFICGVGGAVACSAAAGSPTSETCDNLDNDCDGLVDEGLGLGNACDGRDGLGGCGMGAIECAPGGATRCNTGATGSATPVDLSCEANGCPGEMECAPANLWRCSTTTGASANPDGVSEGGTCVCSECCTTSGTWECGGAGFVCSVAMGGSEYEEVCE